jgi:hypothetical protein
MPEWRLIRAIALNVRSEPRVKVFLSFVVSCQPDSPLADASYFLRPQSPSRLFGIRARGIGSIGELIRRKFRGVKEK